MQLQEPLERVAEDYATSPLNYSSENDLQARLYENTRGYLDKRNELELAQTRGFTIQVSGNLPGYTAQYHDWLESSAIREPLNRVRTELTVWHPLSKMIDQDERPLDRDRDGTEILDLAVLKNPMDRPIHLVSGRYRIEVEMVDAAIEIKYPRTQPKVPSNTRGSLEGLDDDEVRETVDLERPGIQADLEELEALGDEYSITPYFFVCSPYDVFRRDSQTNPRHQRLADGAIEKIRKQCDETSVLYAYPGGWEWIVQN